MNDNPYAVSDDMDEYQPPMRLPRAPLSRSEAAITLLVAGLMGGGAMGSIGYLLLITLIETILVPPFSSPPNYGQFTEVFNGDSHDQVATINATEHFGAE